MAAEGSSASAGLAAEGGSASSGRKVPLPQGDIDATMAVNVKMEELKHVSPDERVVETYRKESDDEFNKLHADVCREADKNSAYLLTKQAELQALIKEEWAKIDFSRVHVGDWDEEAGCYK